MSQVLGIDIGSYSIKFAFLEFEKSTVTLNDVIEVPIPFREQPEDVNLAKIQSIKQALSGVNLSRIQDSIYAGLGSQHAVLQNFEFLKVARKHLAKIVENEFDDLGLFSLDEYIIDYSILERSSKQTNVLGLLIKKSSARSLINILTATHLTCRTIDLNCLALQNLLPYVPQFLHPVTSNDTTNNTTNEGVESYKPHVNFVINVGHQKTSIVMIENSRVVLERSFNLAGHYISKKIEEACKITYQEAVELKHKISSAIEHNSDQSKLAKTVLAECAHEISKEIERIILSLIQGEEEKIANAIVLTGGSSKFVDFAKIVHKQTGVKTSNLAFAEEDFNNNAEIEHVYETFGQAISLGLRASGAKTNSQINIRHGELALSSDYENLIEKIFKYSKLAAVVLMCLFGTYFLRSYLYTDKINQIKNLFNMQVASYFTSEPLELKVISSKANWNFAQYSETAWNLIEQNYDEKTQFIKSLNSKKSMMPLVVLEKISSAVPKEYYFEVSSYNFKDGILALTADTNSRESMEEIIKKISEIKLLSNVQKKEESAQSTDNSKLITFSILATLNSKEST